MTLDEAIKHAEEVVKEKLYEYQECIAVHDMENAMDCEKCGEEHRQLAAWLKELKQLREQTRYISVSESLPKNEQEVLFRTKQGNIHQGIYYSDNKWYSRVLSTWIYFDSILEWMPLPEPYKESEE